MTIMQKMDNLIKHLESTDEHFIKKLNDDFEKWLNHKQVKWFEYHKHLTKVIFYDIIWIWLDSSTRSHLGELAQLVEHLLCTQEVKGSNPLFSIDDSSHQTCNL